jgi:hypothetical protein
MGARSPLVSPPAVMRRPRHLFHHHGSIRSRRRYVDWALSSGLYANDCFCGTVAS